MPIYEYKCPSCDNQFEKKLPFSEYKAPQDCPSCGHGPANKLVSTSSVVFRGDGWADKDARVNTQMRKKNDRLDKKVEERKRYAPVATLKPNVDGERTDTWAEAKQKAKSKGKDTKSYDEQVRKEKEKNSK